MTFSDFKSDFIARVKANKSTRWVRFGIVSVIFFLWVLWLGNAWVAPWWLLLFDIYITGYIPFTWWKRTKNKTVRAVMSWVDAIVYALILVYFIFAYVGQNYQIPSASLEKTLLTGDYLWVNKVLYGPRVPMTPVHFPLVHNKLPIFGCDSYLDFPAQAYHRLKGIRNVEVGDIVVFNFPAGDTIATKYEDSPEYYDLLVHRYGRQHIVDHPEIFGKIKYRPVDRRANFVKRAVGLPGQRLRISGDTIYIDGKAQTFPEKVQFNYVVAADRLPDDDVLHSLEINADDVHPLSLAPAERAYLASFIPAALTSEYIYIVPLTKAAGDELHNLGYANDKVKYSLVSNITGREAFLFPQGISDDWTLSDYGGKDGIYIPRKGAKIVLNATTWAIYQRCIRNYEGHEAYLGGDGLVYVDGKPADTYTFGMDYYFMMGDNRDNSQDSRFWGFVPEDHIVGSPMLVLISFDRDRSIFNGGIRWNRIFIDANPDKK